MPLKKPLISIIVPVYNAEQTIKRCLNSLSNQTIKDLEIIVVDDASNDGSIKVINECIEENENVFLVKNETNMGAGIAKNLGIIQAHAEIIGFCDADDYVDKKYYENMYSALKSFDADIACSDMAFVYKEHIDYANMLENNIYGSINKITYKNVKEPFIVPLEFSVAHSVSASAATKLFKRKIIGTFYEGPCDDLAFTFPALYKANKVVYVPQNYYYYVQSEGSLERSVFNEKRMELADCLTATVNSFANINDNYKEIAQIIYAYSAWTIILDILHNNGRENNLKIYYDHLKYRQLLKDNRYLEYILLSKSFGEQRFSLNLISMFLKEEFERMCILYDKYGNYPITYLPKVSIVIPVYNGSNYLKEAILSALGQDYSNLEVIVVNDGSDDNGQTEMIAKHFGGRIKYYYKENGGVASALNYGIEKMTGEYFSWLSHDDLYKEDKIFRQVEALKPLTDKTTIVVCGYEVVDEKRNKLYDVSPLTQYTKEQLETPLFAVFKGCINGCAALIHKSHFERAGVFNVELPTTQDYDLWFRIMRYRKICFMSGNYVMSRSHAEQDSKKLYDSHLKECNKLWIDLLGKLTIDEMQEMAGSEYEFYCNEKKFFMQLPYKKVIGYLDAKLLDILKSSWELKIGFTIKQMSLLFDIPPQIAKSESIVALAKEKSKKVAIIIPEENNENGRIWKTYEIIKNIIKENVICVSLTDSQVLKCWSVGDVVINYPVDHLRALPHILKLLGCTMAIINDGKQCSEETLYSTCSAMNIKVIAWNTMKHWILQDNKNVIEKADKIIGTQDADISIWSDKLSAQIDCLQSHVSVYIPLVKDQNEVSFIKKRWSEILLEESNLSFEDEYKVDNDILNEIINKSQNAVLWQARNMNLETKVVRREIYLDNEETYWEERCLSILGSTSWKLTKPLRFMADKVKILIHRS